MSVGLRVTSRTEVQMGIQGVMQPLPELQNQLGPSSGHSPLGDFIQIDYPRHIQLY
jgi:hypothetical protein